MVYGRNLHPGSVINHYTHGWAVVDRAEPFGPGSTHADVWLVGVDKAIKVGIASSARRSPALRSVAALARTLWAEVRRLRSALETAERERDQAVDDAHTNADVAEKAITDAHHNANLTETFGALAEQYKQRALTAERERDQALALAAIHRQERDAEHAEVVRLARTLREQECAAEQAARTAAIRDQAHVDAGARLVVERDQALAALARIEQDEPATADEWRITGAADWDRMVTDAQIIAAAARHHIGGNDRG